MKRLPLVLFSIFLCGFAFAEESWLGLYMQGKKIGYSQYTEAAAEVDGKPGKMASSLTVVKSQMLGAGLDMSVNSKSWINEKGELKRLVYDMSSAGRTLKVDATFFATEIKASLDTSGRVSQHTIKIPDGAKIVDDPTATIVAGGFQRLDKPQEFYQFDPTSLTLVKTTMAYGGKVKVDVDGKSFDAELIDMDDPRAPMKMFFSAKGDLIKATGPFGMEMYPETKVRAMDLTTNRGATGGNDIAEASRLVPDVPIANPDQRESLEMLITATVVTRVPTGGHQTVIFEPNGIRVVIHPIRNPNAETTIEAAAKAKPEWIQPDVRVPSNSATFQKLAKEIIGDETRVVLAAEKVRKFVLRTVGVNAGIGVMRDADEILQTKEGVCRDHAILMAAILKAAKIPTKMVAGLVYADGAFYYHAWVEVWDGTQWYGLDSTRSAPYLTATHIKTSDGNVGEAYTGFLLDQAKIKVLSKEVPE